MYVYTIVISSLHVLHFEAIQDQLIER